MAAALQAVDDLIGFVEVGGDGDRLPVEFDALIEGPQIFPDHFFRRVDVEVRRSDSIR